jgi:hypothetical protein
MAGIIKTIVAVTAFIVATAVPAHADKASEIERALATAFDGNDANRNGSLDAAEITPFVDDLFAATDTNSDRLVSHGEFRGLSLTLLPLAQKYGRVRQYAAARERIRRRWTLVRRKTLSAVNLPINAKGELFAIGGVDGELRAVQERTVHPRARGISTLTRADLASVRAPFEPAA